MLPLQAPLGSADNFLVSLLQQRWRSPSNVHHTRIGKLGVYPPPHAPPAPQSCSPPSRSLRFCSVLARSAWLPTLAMLQTWTSTCTYHIISPTPEWVATRHDSCIDTPVSPPHRPGFVASLLITRVTMIAQLLEVGILGTPRPERSRRQSMVHTADEIAAAPTSLTPFSPPSAIWRRLVGVSAILYRQCLLALPLGRPVLGCAAVARKPLHCQSQPPTLQGAPPACTHSDTTTGAEYASVASTHMSARCRSADSCGAHGRALWVVGHAGMISARCAV